MSATQAHSASQTVAVLLAGTPRPGQTVRSGPVTRDEQARVFAAVLDVAQDAVLVTESEPWDEPGPRIVYVNAAFTQHTGWAPEEVLGRNPRLLQGPGTDPAARAVLRDALEHWRPVQIELLNYRKDGTSFWTELSIAPLADETGWFTHWVSVQRDISERKERELRTTAELGLARAILASLPSQTAVLGADGTILAVTEVWMRFWQDNGGIGDSGGVGANYLRICDSADGLCAAESLRTADGIRAVMSGSRPSYTLDYECPSPTEQRWFHLQVVPLEVPAGTFAHRQVLVSHSDITARKQGELALSHQASHDALTGLANRVLLLGRLGGMLASAQDPASVALLFLDLDGFKSVNDSLGHPAGDELLRVAAARLRAAAREQDLVGRLGGDEFLVCCPDVDAASAVRIGQRLADALRAPLQVHGIDLRLSVSTGVAIGRPGATADELLRDADAAMYDAKAHGKDGFVLYQPGLRLDLEEHRRVEEQLRTALDHHGPVAPQHRPGHPVPRLFPVFQPVFTATGRLVSFEALCRLTDTDGAPVRPDAFIGIAEQTGLVRRLGAYVLDAACGQLARWRADAGNLFVDQTVTMAVNISAIEAQEPGFAHRVRAVLERHGLVGRDLVLELTETSLLQADVSTLDGLRGLRADGVGIAIDDFGTGYASLRYLVTLPVSAVKVDQSFTSGVPHDRSKTRIVHAVAGLAADLGLDCVIEGVETQAQRVALPGSAQLQGYLLGRPAPAEAVGVAV